MKHLLSAFSFDQLSVPFANIGFRKLKYLGVIVFPAATLVAFFSNGFLTVLPAVLFFGFVPVFELFLSPDESNSNATEKRRLGADRFYDFFLYFLAAVQIFLLTVFLVTISTPAPIGALDLIGRTFSMGMMCGLLGINLGHELGHRTNRFQRFLGEVTLLTSLENHFLPYHNLGHHRNAATPADPATGRRGETVYAFWFRSQVGSYKQAWQIECSKQLKRGRNRFSFHNRMVCYTIAQVALLALIWSLFGSRALLAFIAAAIIGKLLLETVNYIEHYGLLRRKLPDGRFERVGPQHSWNSDHILGRAILLELSRHSDHHFRASRRYQVLDSLAESPQMPTGYPGMMMFSLIPPLWFRYMNRRIDTLNANTENLS